MQTIDVRPEELSAVLAIVDRYLPGREIRVFGSRVGGKAKPYSDLDLVVMGDAPLPDPVMADLREAFRESNLPFKVDLLDWAATNNAFRRVIEREFVVLRESGVPA